MVIQITQQNEMLARLFQSIKSLIYCVKFDQKRVNRLFLAAYTQFGFFQIELIPYQRKKYSHHFKFVFIH